MACLRCALFLLNIQLLTCQKSRVSQLEEKIDGIVSLLSSSQQTQSRIPTHSPLEQPHSILTPSTFPATSTARNDDGKSLQIFQNSGTHDGMSSHQMANESAAPEYLEIIPGFRVTVDDGNRLLHLYRESYSPFFPFVPISPTTNAYELYSTRPLLFKAVMHVVAPQSYHIQHEFSLWFKEYLAHYVILEQEKRLDILQALLLHIAW